MRRHEGLIYATNVQRTTRRNFMFYCRVNLCKFPEIRQSVIRKDVTYPISVVSIVTRYKIFVLFNFFLYFYAYQRPHFTRVFTFFFIEREGHVCLTNFAVFVPTMSLCVLSSLMKV